MSHCLLFISGLYSTRLGWALIHFLWQAIAIALVLEVALGLAGRKNASLRYLLCALALAAMPVCLVDTYLALGQGSFVSASEIVAESSGTIGIPNSKHVSTGFVLLPVVHTISEFTFRQVFLLRLNRWVPAIAACWVVGVVLLIARKVGGLIVLWRLRRHGVYAPDEAMCELCRRACEKIGVDPRQVYLGISDLVQVPMTMGWVKPVILFPAILLSGLSVTEIELLLAHELAHIRRCDYLVNLIQTLVETLFFFHPVAWWVSRRMRQERENCCDDLVAARSNDVLGYATALFHLEAIRSSCGNLVPAANGGSLLQRIRRLADESGPSSNQGGSVLTAFLIMIVLVAVSMVQWKSASSDERSESSSKNPGHLASETESLNITLPHQVILYQDDFRRKGELDGTGPNVINAGSATWISSTGANQYTTKGDAAAVSPTAYGYSVAYLPVNGTSKVVLDGTRDFALSVVVKPGSTGRTGIALNTGTLARYSNMFTNEFAALSTSADFAGAYAFDNGTINYNYAPGIHGPTMISLIYSASARTLTYKVGATVLHVQTGVTSDQVAAIRSVAIGNDGYRGGSDDSAPTFNDFTFALSADDKASLNSMLGRLNALASNALASL